MATDVFFSPRDKMLKGFDVVCDAVTGTLGPKGLNVFIDDEMVPKITNDGATIARKINLVDKLENVGAKIVKNTCDQTLDDAGDGTTTTATLLQAIVHEAVKRPENPIEIRASLLKAIPSVTKAIKASAKKIDKKDVEKITLISAQDKELARNISEIINKVGEDAVITIEDSMDAGISYDVISGYEAHCGFLSPAFITDKVHARAILKDVPVLVCEKKIAAISDISPLFETFKKQGISQCVIVCEDIEPAMLGVFINSKAMGAFNSVVIKAVGDALKDIEAAVGATRVSDTTGVSFQTIGLEHLGKAIKVVSDVNKTLFIPEDASRARAYANNLASIASSEHNLYIKERMEKRVSQLNGGVAVLKIGTQDFNREYLKDKADDAIKASKVALKEGVVVGGGMCLYTIAQGMKGKTVGEIIIKKALTSPLKKIISNAGKDYAEVIKNMPEGMGYDADKDVYVDMFEKGIIDPAKVERCSVENSITNAANFITAYLTITEHVESSKKD